MGTECIQNLKERIMLDRDLLEEYKKYLQDLAKTSEDKDLIDNLVTDVKDLLKRNDSLRDAVDELREYACCY